MATIAKLDSNGVQVLPEGGRGKTTSPQVHSSTDLTLPADGKREHRIDLELTLIENPIFSRQKWTKR